MAASSADQTAIAGVPANYPPPTGIHFPDALRLSDPCLRCLSRALAHTKNTGNLLGPLCFDSENPSGRGTSSRCEKCKEKHDNCEMAAEAMVGDHLDAAQLLKEANLLFLGRELSEGAADALVAAQAALITTFLKVELGHRAEWHLWDGNRRVKAPGAATGTRTLLVNQPEYPHYEEFAAYRTLVAKETGPPEPDRATCSPEVYAAWGRSVAPRLEPDDDGYDEWRAARAAFEAALLEARRPENHRT